MPIPAISKQQILAALTAARKARHGQGHDDDDHDGAAELAMDQLATQAGVSRATLFHLFGRRAMVPCLPVKPPYSRRHLTTQPSANAARPKGAQTGTKAPAGTPP